MNKTIAARSPLHPPQNHWEVALLVLSVIIDFTAHNYRSYTHLILALGIAREPTVWIQDPPGIGVVRIGGRGTTQNIIAL